jgi:hypothetical protein
MLKVVLAIMLAVAPSTRQTESPRSELQKLRDENANLRVQVAELRKELDRAMQQIAQLRGSVPTTAPVSDPAKVAAIKKAIAEHRLENGMTLDEASKALGSDLYRLVGESPDGVKEYRWGQRVAAWFVDGKIVEWRMP